MSATEDDTELRDLLIQNLETSGVLNKLKAEMRAAVFLAMEEQDRLENKTPLINENLKKCLNTKDGRLVVGLIVDFLQVFNLDFSLAVFQPEINSLNGVDSRDLVCRDLGLSEKNRNCPLLLELVRRGRHTVPEGDKSGDILKEPEGDPSDPQPMGFRPSEESDRKRDLDRDLDRDRDLDLDLEVEDDPGEGDSFFDDPLPRPQKTYGRLSVLAADSEDEPDDRLSDPSQTSELRKVEVSGARVSPAGSLSETPRPGGGSSASEKGGRTPPSSKAGSRDQGPRDQGPRDQGPRDRDPRDQGPRDRDPRDRDPRDQGPRDQGPRDQAPRDQGPRDSKAPNDRPGSGSLHLDDDVEYDDDFNSHRSDLSRSEISIGEEIEEVSIEGPDNSDKFDDITQDLSVSQLSHGADYMEDVA